MERASHGLVERLADGGAFPNMPGSLAVWASPTLALVPLAALLQAAERLNHQRWEHIVRHAAQQLRRTQDVTRWDMPLHLFAPVILAMADFGWREEAQRALQLPAALQRAAGTVPALPGVDWTSSSGLAQLALCWYRLDEPARADAALAAVYRHQESGGGFRGSWGAGAAYHPRRQTVATACFVMDAAVAQVSASFSQHGHNTDEPLAPDDGRLLAVRDALEGLPPGSRVADIGCGVGRYLRWLQPWFPDVRWTGIDASADALKCLPPGIESRRGSLLDLPAEDDEFDVVFCVEALEHALLPEAAIAELCRVTRSGGRIVIIDKHRRFQSLSEHQPWETWFTPDEVCRWLTPFCDDALCVSAA
jgi:2-polyprenyl-3-methyl-5-hydroxy-6-metoxy-1,4-benzoquinol methylase